MKVNCLPVVIGMLAAGCQNTDKPAETGSSATPQSPIEGNWELVENRVNGKLVVPKRLQQFKVFHDGFFSFIMYKPDGSFSEAGAGRYSLDGNQYKETMRYMSDTTLVGTSDWQEWKLDGDTLVFTGFKKVVDRTGKDITTQWSGSSFVEKRVRARR
jgi:hypothetical protein